MLEREFEMIELYSVLHDFVTPKPPVHFSFQGMSFLVDFFSLSPFWRSRTMLQSCLSHSCVQNILFSFHIGRWHVGEFRFPITFCFFRLLGYVSWSSHKVGFLFSHEKSNFLVYHKELFAFSSNYTPSLDHLLVEWIFTIMSWRQVAQRF
jgi:hypothetical protein